MMKMIPVNSEAISAIGYDLATGMMNVRFTNGNLYTFCGVPRGVADAFLSASSHGEHYNVHIRGKYSC